MKKRNASYYFSTGITFLKEHPQVWFTALVGLVIISTYIFMAARFVSIAQDAQKQLFNDRAGWLLDGIVLFAQDSINNRELVRSRFATLKEENKTLDSVTMVTQHGNDDWLVYVSDDGEREGSLANYSPHLKKVLSTAWFDEPASMWLGEGESARVWTAKAVKNAAGQTNALVLLSVAYSEADRRLAHNINTSMALMVGVLIIIMVLFVRHARIVDYALLYKKQLEIDEMKDGFISMASHELKSPLSVIRGYIEYLKDGDLDEKTQQEFLGRIDVSADELRMLIDDILDVSRIEMGRMRFSPDYVTSAEVLDDVFEMFSVSARDKGLNLTCTINDDARRSLVRVDKSRLKQVLVNLVSNAVKYTLEGDIKIEQKIVGNSVEISVRDSGVGMTQEEQQKLFQKFYRVEAKETRGVRGTGLGLWITQYITEQMGGTISVESIKGEGSRFVVAFPKHIKGDVSEENTST